MSRFATAFLWTYESCKVIDSPLLDGYYYYLFVLVLFGASVKTFTF